MRSRNGFEEFLAELPASVSAQPRTMAEIARRSRRIRLRRLSEVAALVLTPVLVASSFLWVTPDGSRGVAIRTRSPAITSTTITPAEYLDTVLNIIADNSYYVTAAQLQRWRTAAHDVSATARTTTDTYQFIDSILTELDPNDPDSQGQSLWAPDRVAAYDARPPDDGAVRPSSSLSGSVGYLILTPTTDTPTSAAGASYIMTVRNALDPNICKWIVDLRAPYPSAASDAVTMISAVAPLLGTGRVISFQTRTAAVTQLAIAQDGSVVDEVSGRTLAPPVSLRLPRTPHVAVLQDPSTTSAFESLLIAFERRQAVQTFGQFSAGHSTVDTRFALPDGAAMWLTTEVVAAADGTIFDRRIVPATTTATATGADPARDAATSWLLAQPTCG